MPSKYKNKITEYDGKRFDSRAEAARYQELQLRERAGDITSLVCQPSFTLVDKSRYGRAIVYRGDFAYNEQGKRVVEDVKGVETAVFKIKARLFRERYPDIELRLVKL